MAGAVALVLLVPPSLRAAAVPASYGDAVEAAVRSPLAARVEQVAVQLARGQEPPGAEGRQEVVVDARLEAALDLLMGELPASGPPPGGVSEQALWLSGIVEPVPYLMTMTVPVGADDDVVRQLGRVLTPVLARGRYRRVAASTAPLAEGGLRVALALQESFVELRPVARALPGLGRAAIEGSVLAPYQAPELFVTAPDGNVRRLASVEDGDPRRFNATFQCPARPGAYQIEVAAEDRLGDAVLANFPVHCAAAAPRGIVVAAASATEREERAAAAADAGRTPEEVGRRVEARLLDLLQRDRTAAGLPALHADGRLAAVARAHSLQMRDDHFFGHISPTTGSALDRLSRAGVRVVRARENIGRAYSAVELERGLMGSPSHRANILASDVDQVGIGVAVGAVAAGASDLFLTQLFARLPAPFDARRTAAVLRARVAALRRAGGLPALGADAALDRLAREVAVALADGTLDVSGSPHSGPVERALPSLEGRYRWVRRVSGKALDVSQFGSAPALLDRAVTHAGVAVAPGKAEPDGGAPLWLVVLLGARR